ncbi:MAG: DNA mismatch repair endonuclease MutL [Erysipelotrichaceae bacterium]|nr:DNA mismatch repair endonuclease MutL [Erysipelotrichaceae bacterium]
MSRINILDEHLTNMIAAGEVVERPSGVVKELVENSIDAGAGKISVRVTEGGLSGIEVKDDGCGMDPVDATRAFSRHATSKIREANDLWSISTMGFRGEALPSIASVAKVEMLTNDGQQGTEVKIEYGKITSASPARCPQGTAIKVEGLFHKTPARLKHLKSGSSEMNSIMDLMQKFALSHPEISFELYSDDRLRLQTNGNGSLLETVMILYGIEVARNAIEVSFEDYDFKVEGIIVQPQISRSNKQYIQVFMNGRIVRSLALQRAITDGYSGFMMPERFPIVVLNIQTDYSLVDVNVHPSKWEIRISKERQLYSLLTEKIRETLSSQRSSVGEITLRENRTQPRIEESRLFTESYVELPSAEQTSKPEETLKVGQYEAFREETGKYTARPAVQIQRFTYLAQYHGSYILAYDEKNLYIVDQHAAQERVMYEEIQRQILENKVYTQPLLVPLVLELTPAKVAQLDRINETLSCISMTAEPFSSNSIIIREEPLWFENIDQQQFLNDLIDEILSDRKMNLLDIRKEKIASLACHSSVRFNHYLSEEESRRLLERLSGCSQPFNCPHGRPTMMAISDDQLIREFKR